LRDGLHQNECCLLIHVSDVTLAVADRGEYKEARMLPRNRLALTVGMLTLFLAGCQPNHPNTQLARFAQPLSAQPTARAHAEFSHIEGSGQLSGVRAA
jgi:hypothetical protein